MFIFKFPFGPFETNAILVGCEKTLKAAIVDPSPGSGNAILQKVKEHGLTVEKVLLTHSHWDHFADAFSLKEKTGAPLYVHPLDAKNIELPGSDGIPLFIPIAAVKADHFLNEGDVITVGSLNFEVIHSPGHSPGSVCYYMREKKVLLSGDTLFQGSIGNLSLPTGQPELMWRSLDKLAKLPAETRVIPGHGADTTIGKEHWLSRAKQIFSE